MMRNFRTPPQLPGRSVRRCPSNVTVRYTDVPRDAIMPGGRGRAARASFRQSEPRPSEVGPVSGDATVTHSVMKRAESSRPPIVIVGSGFAGLGMAIRLKRAGIESFTVLEKGADVGGTWRENRYPGCACDVPSHLYSYSIPIPSSRTPTGPAPTRPARRSGTTCGAASTSTAFARTYAFVPRSSAPSSTRPRASGACTPAPANATARACWCSARGF